MRNVNHELAKITVRDIASFILTMRNVNIINKYPIVCEDYSFILTMRNVNTAFDIDNLIAVSEFYINYEECKCNRMQRKSRTNKSFILTMRNVN